jgi:hypothetical protein
MEQLTLKRGDVHNVPLSIGNPPIDLSAGVAKVHVRPSLGGATQIFNATLNGNTVTWPYPGTLPVGKYILEVQVTLGGSVVTAPSDEMMELTVMQDLA